MKKILSIALLLTMILSLAVIPASAAERKNIMTLDNFEIWAEFGLTSNPGYVPECQFDGSTAYDPANSATYCDCRLADGKTALLDGTAMMYDIIGDPGAKETPYYAGVQYKLDKAYTISGIAFYLQNAIEGIPQAGNIDGFDFYVSETGEDDDWKLVASFSELVCGKKLQVATDEATGLQVCYVTADFEPVTARYFAYGLTGLRCQHPEALMEAYGLEPTTAPHFYRISEIELYEADAAATTTAAPETTTAAPETTTAAPETTTAAPETTTAAPETTTAAPETTTAAPETTTAAPGTTAAPTETPSTADMMPIVCIALMLAAAACLMLRKKFN